MCNVMSSHDCAWVKGRSFGQAGKTRDCPHTGHRGKLVNELRTIYQWFL